METDADSPYERQSNAPLVSVIIPTFNRLALLEAAINSVRKQDYSSVEIIVVDDGSTDETKSRYTGVSDIRFFSQVNQGASAARNLGMRHARGEFLAFLDSDDYWESNFLRACVGRLLESNAGLAFANWNEVDESGEVMNPDILGGRTRLNSLDLQRSGDWESLSAEQTRDLFLRKTLTPPSGIVLRRSLFSHDWALSISIGEDRLFVLEGLFNNPVSAEFTRQVYWAYRIHGSNSCTNNPDHVRVSRGEIEAEHELLNRLGDRLSADQAALSKRALAASYLDLGYHLSLSGERSEAMRAYRASLKLRWSTRAAVGMLKARVRRPWR